jgi:hypothetical protein
VSDDPNRNEVEVEVPFDTRNLPSSDYIRTFACSDSDCKHVHLVGFSEGHRALFHMTMDQEMLDGIQIHLHMISKGAR